MHKVQQHSPIDCSTAPPSGSPVLRHAHRHTRTHTQQEGCRTSPSVPLWLWLPRSSGCLLSLLISLFSRIVFLSPHSSQIRAQNHPVAQTCCSFAARDSLYFSESLFNPFIILSTFADWGILLHLLFCLFIVFILNGSLLISMILPSHMNMDHMKSLLCPICSQYITQEGRGASAFCDRISFQWLTSREREREKERGKKSLNKSANHP